MTRRSPTPARPVEQLAAGRAFFAELGLDVSHFGAIWHIFKVGQLLATDLNRVSALHDVSIADFHLLGALMMNDPVPMRATDLAHALNVSNAALTGRVRKLAQHGLLSPAPDPHDRRTRLLHLTPEGVLKVRAIGRSLQDEGRFVQHYRHMQPADREALDRIMGNLHTLLDRDFTP